MRYYEWNFYEVDIPIYCYSIHKIKHTISTSFLSIIPEFTWEEWSRGSVQCLPSYSLFTIGLFKDIMATKILLIYWLFVLHLLSFVAVELNAFSCYFERCPPPHASPAFISCMVKIKVLPIFKNLEVYSILEPIANLLHWTNSYFICIVIVSESKSGIGNQKVSGCYT